MRYQIPYDVLQDLSRSPAAILNRTGSSDDASAPTSPNYFRGRCGEAPALARAVTPLAVSTALLRDEEFKDSLGGMSWRVLIVRSLLCFLVELNFFF